MSALRDITGQRFGRLEVIAPDPNIGHAVAWRCLCDCGASVILRAVALGRTTASCGCLRRDLLAARNRTHGKSREAEYPIWLAMIGRCERPSTTYYEYYGGRGISVCPRWRASFEAFLADMGPRPSSAHQLERVDNDGHYEPGNCRWATRSEQQRNTSRSRVIDHDGKSLTLVEWSEATGISHELIRARIDRLGWSPAKALLTPVRGRENTCNR